MPFTTAAFLVSFALGPTPAPIQEASVVFMEPAGVTDAVPPIYRPVENVERLARCQSWLENEAAHRALGLYATAWRIAHPDGPPATLHIALVPGGNHADVGFQLAAGDEPVEFGTLAYLKLDEASHRFGITLLHETGHTLLTTLTAGRRVAARSIASLPHTTAALTDRGTAFDEGFAIHLETLAAHLADSAELRARYHHERMDVGSSSFGSSEYFRHSSDLTSYSQSRARYHHVRENDFAFATACREPDYLRVQLEKARDFSTLRDANQLLQSEGFHASFFFALTVRGAGLPSADLVRERQQRMLTVLADSLPGGLGDPEAPHLLLFVESYLARYPEQGREVVDLLLELCHGVFVDAGAADLWREHYLAALRLDLRNLGRQEIAAARARWRAAVLEDPSVLHARLGPQLPCRVRGPMVSLVALGQGAPLAFDLNTAQEGVLRLIPDIGADEVQRWLVERARAPFQDVREFLQRVALDSSTLVHLEFAWAEGSAGARYELNDPLGDELVPLLEDGVRAVEAYFGRPFSRPFAVEVLPDRAGFDASLPPEWGLGQTQCWMVATGVADALRMLSPRAWGTDACEHDAGDDDHVRGIVTHELVHVFHGQANPTGDFVGAEDVGWFGEGLAVLVSGQLDDPRHAGAARAALDQGAAPRRLAESWSGPHRYGVTGSLVRYLELCVGREGLLRMLAATSEAGLLDIAGMSAEELLGGWSEFVRLGG